MELNTKVIHDVIHPTSAFAQGPSPNDSNSTAPGVDASSPSWQESLLNPKNRIDSLEPLANPLWRIDGCTGLGTQFYAVPLFLDNPPPMRFDVFIPEEAASTPTLRALLDLDAAFHTKDATRVNRLGVSRHILRALQIWTQNSGLRGPGSFTDVYTQLPFGSRIVFKTLELDVRSIRITIAPMHNLERQLLSVAKLQTLLGLRENALPELADVKDLHLVQQLHDSVCLVHMNTGRPGENAPKSGRSGPWILKALTSGSKYLYHELKNLLDLPPHRHITSRPRYLVTKRCRFGGKTAVIGFILPYYSGGSLRDSLPLLRIQDRLTPQQQLKWAQQLTAAVLHVREKGKIFYPDLRLDNVVLSDTGDIVMVDFEQRGVWCEFAAPEVNALEYIRILANAESTGDNAEDFGIPEEVRQRYADLLSLYLPGWEAIEGREEYTPPDVLGYGSYNISWLYLDAEEQEAAEVYMLGRVLWCLFEGQSAPQPGAVWQSYRREPDLEFPAFRRTPLEIRGLIDGCTNGRRQVLSSLITRIGSRLVLRSVAPGRPQDPDKTVLVAKQWWSEEMREAEAFLQKRTELKKRGEWSSNYYGRPKLREVLAALEAFKDGKAYRY